MRRFFGLDRIMWILIGLIAIVAVARIAVAEDAIKAQFFDSPHHAALAAQYNERAHVIPTLTADQYDPWTGTTRRLSWLAVTPHPANGYDSVPSAPAPPVELQVNCGYACSGTLYVCSKLTLAPPFFAQHFSSAAARDYAYWFQTDSLERPYVASLTLPLGTNPVFLLLRPSRTMESPSIFCGE
jgi:hypothetical protein